ncbi:hypothetical protein ACQPU1_04815 [Clostridium paraputrificum]|uniref:hypothetical protein n=1 Tax=Clostridium paraputrificum TaxID=29363 RepID=UPI003D33F1A5
MKVHHSKSKDTYYTHMGKAGPLVIKAPVVLSDLKILIPISTILSLDKDYISATSDYNKVIISKLELKNEKELLISGFLLKLLECSILENNRLCKYNRVFKIPIDKKICIEFNQQPNLSCKCCNTLQTFDSEPINCHLDSIELLKDSSEYSCYEYLSEMIISVRLSLSQVQNVFIPEPEGNVYLQSKGSKNFILAEDYNKDFYYLVGENPKKGLIAEKVIIDND